MTRKTGWAAVAMAVVVVQGSVAGAATTVTSNLPVSATVNPGCSISTSGVAFGTYAPLAAHATSAATANGTVTVQCTLGTVATVTLGQGTNPGAGSTDASPARRLSDGASHYLTYSLYSDALNLFAWGNTALTGVGHVGVGSATGLTVYGKLDAGQVVPAGAYTDTVVATVSF